MSNIKYDIINIVDFEITCPDEDSAIDFKREIVEVGIVGVSFKERSIVYKQNMLIKPQFSKITKAFTDLTGIQESWFGQALKFKKAFAKLQSDFLIARRPWIGYGYDNHAIKNNCELLQCQYPFSQEYTNLHLLIAMMTGDRERLSLENYLKKFNMEFQGNPHRALDDALNTARLYMKIIWNIE